MAAPPWTNAWDETKPADTDLANTLGTQGRQVKLDVRQRLDWQHVWNVSTSDDGGHRFVAIASAYHPANTSSFSAAGYSLTGANAQSAVDLAGTWNTSGTPTGIKLNILDTGSNAASLLMDLQIGGSSKFKVKKDGTVTSSGAITANGVLLGAGKSLGAAVSQSISSGVSAGAVAATDGFITAYVVCVASTDAYVFTGQVDGVSLQRVTASTPSTGINHAITFPVKSGSTWAVSLSIVTGTPAISACYFTPLS